MKYILLILCLTCLASKASAGIVITPEGSALPPTTLQPTTPAPNRELTPQEHQTNDQAIQDKKARYGGLPSSAAIKRARKSERLP